MKLYRNIDGKSIELNNQEYEEYYIRTKENEYSELYNYKKQKIDILKKTIESIFYLKYPLYKQNNIAIFGTEEEKNDFKKFYEETIKKYELEKEKINNLTSIE